MTIESSFKMLRRMILKIFIVIQILFHLGVEGTLNIISENTNETVFSAEEAGIDSASAYGLQGHLVTAVPIDACTTVDPPPPLLIDSTGPHAWILMATVNLIETDNSCSLSKKAKNAQAAGYSGIILRRIGSNTTDGIIPQFIGLDWVGVRIYACIVGDDIGAFIMDRYVYPSRHYVKFDNEPYYPMALLLNFFIVGFLAIICVLLLLRVFHYLYFSVTTRVVERRRRKKTLLSESQLRKLPILKWSQNIPQDTCSICIDQFENDDEIRVLPCSHVFHKICIDPWLLKESRKCPNCKGRVLFPNERGRYTYSSDSEDETAESGDERTPLLRPRENYRFIDTLTESHNSRALQDQYQYLQDPDQSEDEPPTTSQQENTLRKIKVTFAPAVSVLSSSSSNSSITTSTNTTRHNQRPKFPNAFVLPMAAKPKRGRKSILTSPPSPTGQLQNEEKLTTSTSSSETLIDFYDIPTQDTAENSSLTNSTQSYHSCVGFDSEYPSLDRGSINGGSSGSNNEATGGMYGSFNSLTSDKS